MGEDGSLAARFGRTLRMAIHARPDQLYHRLRLRAKRTLWSRMGERVDARYRARAAELPPARLDLPGLERVAALRSGRRSQAEAASIARDAVEGRFTFLGVRREFGEQVDWYRPDLDAGTRLWKTLLHEFPYALDLARGADDDPRCRERLFELARSWSEASPIARPGFALDAWNARAVATRLVNWGLAAAHLGLGPEDRDGAFLSEALAVHGLFLRDNLEVDLRANHLMRDAVGLVFADGLCGVAPDALALLEAQVQEQILPDGCHYERVPLYHAIVLQDLVEARTFLGSRAPGWLSDAIANMAAFLAHLLPESGRLPLLGDTWLGEIDAARLLDEAGPDRAPAPARERVAAHSGLVVLKSGDLHAVMRAGRHGPDAQLGHAHADGLSFELCRGTRKLITDTGTGTYDEGPMRARSRATAAHNTLQIDAEEQLEAWGSFRVGRRGQARVLAQGAADGWTWVSAAHDGFRWLPGAPIHHRWLGLHEGGVLVLDAVLGEGEHAVRSALHLHPEARAGATQITALAACAQELSAPLHERFNETQESTEVFVEATSRLPWAGGWWIAPHGGQAEAALRFEEDALIAICRHPELAIEVRWQPRASGEDAVVLCPPRPASAT